MRIATWNIERPRASQKEKLDGLLSWMQSASLNVDIWILTETNACVSPGPQYRCVASPPITGPERYSKGENRTTIWSRFPIKKTAITHDPETAVCAEIEGAFGPLLVYGTIIPYQHAGTRFPYRFEGEVVAGRKGWELHYESIAHHATEWRRLRKDFPKHGLCIAGDMNQNRDGRRWYGTKQGREQFGLALVSAGMTCVTGGPIQSEEGVLLDPVIDHICLDRNLAQKVASVSGWAPGTTQEGKSLSDHSGVYVDLTPSQ